MKQDLFIDLYKAYKKVQCNRKAEQLENSKKVYVIPTHDVDQLMAAVSHILMEEVASGEEKTCNP